MLCNSSVTYSPNFGIQILYVNNVNVLAGLCEHNDVPKVLDADNVGSFICYIFPKLKKNHFYYQMCRNWRNRVVKRYHSHVILYVLSWMENLLNVATCVWVTILILLKRCCTVPTLFNMAAVRNRPKGCNQQQVGCSWLLMQRIAWKCQQLRCGLELDRH